MERRIVAGQRISRWGWVASEQAGWVSHLNASTGSNHTSLPRPPGPANGLAPRLDLQRRVPPLLPDLPSCRIASWQQNPAKLILRRFFGICNLLPINHFPAPTPPLVASFCTRKRYKLPKGRGTTFLVPPDLALRPGRLFEK